MCYKFNSDKGLIGWSLMREVEDNEANRNGHLYFGVLKKYDLSRIYTTKELINHHCKELFLKVETQFNHILK